MKKDSNIDSEDIRTHKISGQNQELSKDHKVTISEAENSRINQDSLLIQGSTIP